MNSGFPWTSKTASSSPIGFSSIISNTLNIYGYTPFIKKQRGQSIDEIFKTTARQTILYQPIDLDIGTEQLVHHDW